MENNMTDKIMLALSAIATIASAVVLVILISSIISTGFTTIRIFGLIATIVSTILMGVVLMLLLQGNKQSEQKIVKG